MDLHFLDRLHARCGLIAIALDLGRSRGPVHGIVFRENLVAVNDRCIWVAAGRVTGRERHSELLEVPAAADAQRHVGHHLAVDIAADAGCLALEYRRLGCHVYCLSDSAHREGLVELGNLRGLQRDLRNINGREAGPAEVQRILAREQIED